MLKDEIELDEIYVLKCHKGKHFNHIKGRKRGGSSSYSGLSRDQVCILTGVERFKGNRRYTLSYAHSFNIAKPTSENILNLKEHIENGSFIWTDGLASYNELIRETKCNHKTLPTTKKYDKVNHLNNVNYFHSRIQSQYRVYRGVSSKYINRYCSLFSIHKQYTGSDDNEVVVLLMNRLRYISDTFYIRQILNCNIFDVMY